MKEELPKYPNYRMTEIAWIGSIPSHWETRQLGYISNRVSVGLVINPSSYVSDEGVPFLLGGDIQEFKINTKNCNYCEKEISDGVLQKSRLNHGDLVVVRVGYPGIAAVVPPELEGSNCASMMVIRKHPRFISQWLAYIFNSQIGRDQVGIVQYGAAQKQFNISHAVKFRFPFPPLDEQNAIACFLDRETAKIDRLMDVRRKQIETLQEQRTAVIHHAVTKGLDPQAKMKPSGVEWLGDVPEGWFVKRLKFIALCNQQTLGEQTKADYLIDYIDIGNVSSKGEILEIQSFEFKDAPSRARRKVKQGSTIISMVRTYLKAIAFLQNPDKNVIVSTGFAVLDAKKEVRPSFLYHALSSEYCIQRIIVESKGVGYPAINSSDLINIPLVFPARLSEQDEILIYIEKETFKLDTLISKYQREIELLAEYRASLISHAVTGKIDVRGLVEV